LEVYTTEEDASFSHRRFSCSYRTPLAGYEDIGEQPLKNIIKPVRVYRIPLGPVDSKAEIARKAPKRFQWVAIAVVAAFVAGIGAVTLWNQYRQGTTKEESPLAQEARPAAAEKPSIAVLDKVINYTL
jgi:hypothetical protein